MRDFDPTASEFISSGYIQRSQPGGPLYDFGSILGSVTGFLGGPVGKVVSSVAGPLIGGLIQGDSADDASAAASNSASETNALNKYIYEDQKALNQPLYQNGLWASNRLAALLNPNGGVNTQFQFNAQDLQNDPSYAFRMQQGVRALDNSGAARGMSNSGAQLKALTRYGQDYASTEYGNAYNRAQGTFNQNLQNTLNPLQSLAGQAQTSASALGNAGTNYANQSAANSSGLANSLGAASIASGNALSNGLTGATNNYNSQNLLQQLLGNNGGAPAWQTAVGANSYGYGSGGYTGGMSLNGA